MSTEPQPEPDAPPPQRDVILYNAPITYNGYYKLLDICRTTKSERVLLLLTTTGGDPHAGYRIARCLSDTYEHVTAYITSFCKSAGTLAVFGADEIVIGDSGELGPLDVQIRKKDELLERWSGNDLAQGLLQAMQHSLKAYRETFMEICMGAGLSAAIGADAAANVVTGLFGRIFEQIDPSRLGEIARANQISLAYGTRLIGAQNQDLEQAVEMQTTLRRLVFEYPAHGFVIDRAEAEGLFSNVRGPTEAEQHLAESLLGLIREPRGTVRDPESGIVKRLFPSDEPHHETDTSTGEQPAAHSPEVAGGAESGVRDGAGNGAGDRGGGVGSGQGHGSADGA